MRRAATCVAVFLAVLGLTARGVVFSHSHEDGEDPHVHGPATHASSHHPTHVGHRHAHGHGHGHRHGHGPSGPHAPREPGLPCPGEEVPALPAEPSPEGEHTHVTGLDAAARAASPAAMPGQGRLACPRGLGLATLGGVRGPGGDHRPTRPGPGTGPPTALVADDLLAHLVSQGSGLLL